MGSQFYVVRGYLSVYVLSTVGKALELATDKQET